MSAEHESIEKALRLIVDPNRHPIAFADSRILWMHRLQVFAGELGLFIGGDVIGDDAHDIALLFAAELVEGDTSLNPVGRIPVVIFNQDPGNGAQRSDKVLRLWI